MATHSSPLLALLIDTARVMRSEFSRRARDHKLSLLQWRTLGVLARQDGLTQSVIAARIEVSPMTMSDTIDRLEKHGYVRREPDPTDSRAKLVLLTPAALPIIEEMRLVAQHMMERALTGIAPDESETLIRLLGQIMTNLETTAPCDAAINE
ncbi:MarR family winged helix-turn-helix transcriptional regulator [Pararhodobacter zhoushanensis]|uniref:MarR family transcriptional regulator n=1 Tax=Pararhodobacter zhoushanensis TaxID=2479545 RepID=A0ABT3H2P3_9RHOB|nr:MarR family transcriptional regulator [Pararhodobacter zhoushanensis]MCW1934069.1 MarR family transcriptional regulator [Pararhodobacter zhoushanensis]